MAESGASGLALPPSLPLAAGCSVYSSWTVPEASREAESSDYSRAMADEGFPFRNSQTRFSELSGRLPLGRERRNVFVGPGHHILN